MEAVEFLKEEERMCKSIPCPQCELSTFINNKNLHCEDYRKQYPEKYVEVVDQWSKEHPKKTMLSDLKDKYPNSIVDSYGVPQTCPFTLGIEEYEERPCKGRDVDCKYCWNRELE